MKALVVYDSEYGNTASLAQDIADTLGDEAKVLRAGDVNSTDLESIEVLIVGSPTQGGRPTQAIKSFLSEIPATSLQGVGVTAFDTRISAKDHGVGMRILVGIFGYAAPRIAASLQAKGGSLVADPEGFTVDDKEGPLKQGEVERAASRSKRILLRRRDER